MRLLSKSRMLAYRQCHRRLWLEVHRPDLREDSAESEARFSVGHKLNEIARQIYDPKRQGRFIDVNELGAGRAIELSKNLLSERTVLFEAGFSAGGVLAFTDIMTPVVGRSGPSWKIIEVKSSTSVKDYHRDDAAVQAFVMRSAGMDYASISLAYIDKTFVYDPKEGYEGLLAQENLTKEADARFGEVAEWVKEAQSIVGRAIEPPVRTGPHCTKPYECGFYDYCSKNEPRAAYPASVLPRVQSKKLKTLIADNPLLDLSEIADDLLNDLQRRVKLHTISNTVFFDQRGAARALAKHAPPAYFMDFETAQIAIPIFDGMRPYQQVPFQFSVHCVSRKMELSHADFVDLSGRDPSEEFAKNLVEVVGTNGPVFVYNAAFEKGRIQELARKIPRLKKRLLALNDRIVDLLPIARTFYYHPAQKGSWSIKDVLPTIAPDLSYDELDGVQHGGDAMSAYEEAILPQTMDDRRLEIERQLQAYCRLDTYAMVRMWEVFTGKSTLG